VGREDEAQGGEGERDDAAECRVKGRRPLAVWRHELEYESTTTIWDNSPLQKAIGPYCSISQMSRVECGPGMIAVSWIFCYGAMRYMIVTPRLLRCHAHAIAARRARLIRHLILLCAHPWTGHDLLLPMLCSISTHIRVFQCE